MAGFTLKEIREALAEQLRSNITRGITVAAYHTEALPSITIEPATDYVDYWQSFGATGVAAARFVLVLDPGASDRVSAGIALDDYLSVGTGNDSSVVDAVMAVKTLGLTGCSVFCRSVEVDPVDVTARFLVEVHIQKVGANA